MKCPICTIDLVIADRQGMEIDYCPQCRGVWLDRGELDKIIERSLAASSGPSTSAPAQGAYREPSRDFERPAPRRDYDDDDYDDGHKRKKRRRSFLDDLFDFD